MDIDELRAARIADWERLDALSRRRSLTGAEADELVDRYQSAAADLSAITTDHGSTAIGEKLSVTLSRARRRFTGAPRNAWDVVAQFFVLRLPTALFRARWSTLAAAVLTLAISGALMIWLSHDTVALYQFASPAQIKQYSEHSFVEYYTKHPHEAFAVGVWTNNAFLALQCIAGGITGLYPIAVIVQNAVNIGIVGALMLWSGHGGEFFAYLLPHGLLELTSVFVAAGAGFQLFWSVVAPGPMARSTAVARAGRSLFTITIGIAISLFVSGMIEGFVTPSGLPAALKIAIGAIALLAFCAYAYGWGFIVTRRGASADLDSYSMGRTELVAG